MSNELEEKLWPATVVFKHLMELNSELQLMDLKKDWFYDWEFVGEEDCETTISYNNQSGAYYLSWMLSVSTLGDYDISLFIYDYELYKEFPLRYEITSIEDGEVVDQGFVFDNHNMTEEFRNLLLKGVEKNG